MSIDTNPTKNWNPYHALAVTGIWLVLVVLFAIVIGHGCGNASPAPTNSSISLPWSITDLGDKPVSCAQVAATVSETETAATSVRRGAYLMAVRGKLGAMDGWRRDDTLVVPPPGKLLTHPVGQMRLRLTDC